MLTLELDSRGYWADAQVRMFRNRRNSRAPHRNHNRLIPLTNLGHIEVRPFRAARNTLLSERCRVHRSMRPVLSVGQCRPKWEAKKALAEQFRLPLLATAVTRAKSVNPLGELMQASRPGSNHLR